MDSDSFFAIGKTHKVCQDFALSGHDLKDGRYAAAVLSDGCSSAPMTDFGARILSTCAMSFMVRNRRSALTLPADTIARTIMESASACPTFGIPKDALHATLLTALLDKERGFARVLMFGDGAVAIHENGVLRNVVYVEYELNAPFYPVYLCRDRDCDMYLETEIHGKKVVDTKRVVRTITFFDNSEPIMTTKETSCLEHLDLPFTSINGLTLTLLSDGIDLFGNGVEYLPWLEVLKEAVGFKNTCGEYVRRRQVAFLKRMAAQQIAHEDDFSVASITA